MISYLTNIFQFTMNNNELVSSSLLPITIGGLNEVS